jgi:SAM-dependent methyltransferase
MKRCLTCKGRFDSDDWICPQCGYHPAWRDDIVQFAEDSSNDQAGFKPEYFARLAAIEETNFWFRSRNELIQWALCNYFPNAASFFEIGCGTGFVLKGLRETAPRLRLAGSEVFGDGLAFARARLPGVDLYQMDARQIPFEDEFDVIGAFDVLEHIVEDNAVLLQMFRATRRGGGVLVTVPQHRFLWSAIDEHSMHRRRYGRADLRRKVESAGFQIERIISFNSLLLPIMIWSRMRRKRDQNFQLWREFEITPVLNKTLETILTLERMMIIKGVSFPAGGSLLLIGRKPLTPRDSHSFQSSVRNGR